MSKKKKISRQERRVADREQVREGGRRAVTSDVGVFS